MKIVGSANRIVIINRDALREKREKKGEKSQTATYKTKVYVYN